MEENQNPEIVTVTEVIEKPVEKKPRFSFPTAFTVLFIVLLLATLLTWIVPAGKFKTLTYDSSAKVFVVTDKEGNTEDLPADQKTLDERKISIGLDSFVNGEIKKPIAIPGTYERIPNNPQGFIDFIKAPVEGVVNAIEVIVFVLILGGVIGLVNKTGAFDAGITVLSKLVKGKEFLLVVIIFSLVALGGTTFGFAEETIAFYPILMPVFLASGFDAMVAIATIYMGSAIGTMFSTTNPFATVIASNAAGISFSTGMNMRIISLVLGSIITLLYIWNYTRKVRKDPMKSVVYDDMDAVRARFLKSSDDETGREFTLKKKLILIIFGLAFPVMVWGVAGPQGWWFQEISALFLFVGIVIMFLSGLSEKEAVGTFLQGASELVSVALIIGVAGAINIILDKGSISDTMLNATANAVTGMNGLLFIALLFVLFSILGIFIPSSSGLATLSMPIVAPLADAVNMGRDVVVSAYNYGQGWMAFITPTGLILATLEMAGVTYNKWLKFIMPLMGIMGVFSIIMIYLQTIFR